MLEASLQSGGLDICQPFVAQWYNSFIADEGLSSKLAPIATFGREQTRAYLVGNTKVLWPHFMQWWKQYGRAEAHPIDAYCAQLIESSMDRAYPNLNRARYWGCDPSPTLVSMQRVAEVSGLCHHDKTTHLSLHPVYGSWISFRAVVVVDLPAADLLPPLRVPCPMSAQDKAASEAMLNRALAAADSDAAEYSQKSWELWLAMRDSVSVGREYRFCKQQIKYHYTADVRVLDEENDG